MDLFQGVPADQIVPGLLYLLAFLAVAIGALVVARNELIK